MVVFKVVLGGCKSSFFSLRLCPENDINRWAISSQRISSLYLRNGAVNRSLYILYKSMRNYAIPPTCFSRTTEPPRIIVKKSRPLRATISWDAASGQKVIS